jgi:hypothetical protein
VKERETENYTLAEDTNNSATVVTLSIATDFMKMN